MLSASFSRSLLNVMPHGDGLDRVFLCLMFLGILLVAAVLAEAGRLLAERFFAAYRKSENSREIAVTAAMVLTMYALLLAFAIITLYDQHRDAEAAVAREGSDLSQLARDVTASAGPKALLTFRDDALAYLKFVIVEEFPAMHDGREVPPVPASMCVTNLFTGLQNANPGAPSRAAFHDAAVRSLNDVVVQRHARLGSADAALPSPFVFLLFLAGGISVGLMCFVKASDASVERGLVVSVAVVIASGVLAAFVLEFPFSGPLAISSDSIAEGFLADSDYVNELVLPEHASCTLHS